MSKALRTVGMVVGAVALIAATAGLAAPAVAATATTAATAGGVLGVSAATLAAIGTYGSLAAGVLSMAAGAMAPGFSAEGSPTTFTTNPQSGLPYAMGRTRMSGLRVYARTYDGFKQQSKDDILAFVVMLSIAGPIHSIEKFTADNEVVTFESGGTAIGRFDDYMSQKVSLGAPGAAALDDEFGGKPYPDWTANHKLSGIAHAQWALRFDTDGDLYGAGAQEPAWTGKWVKVYDPRKDSTYPGGSGAHRALNEATYEWSDNPGLHALTWALGRWQNGKRVCGIGAPVANIRVAEFVECANVCDANNWKVGGVEWTTDSKWDTMKRMLQAGGAIPTQTGAMIGCLTSTPRTAIATIERHHLLDGFSFASTKSRRDRFNTVIPRYVDEDSDWAVISGTAVTEPTYVTDDGGQRTKEIDFPLVQVFAGETAEQPGQLAAYAIVNSREGGPFNWTTGPEWIGLKTGDVVYLNVPEEGLVNQPVLITRRAPDPATGKVSFAGETETYSKHAYALGQSTTPPAPFSLSAPDLKPAAPLSANWSVSGATSGEGFPALLVTGESEMPSADAVVIDYRLAGAEDWTSSAILSAVGPVSHVIAPLDSETAYDVRIGYRVGTSEGNFTLFANVTTGLGKVTIIEEQLQDHDAALDQLETDTATALTNIAAAEALITSIQSSVTADIGALTADVGTVSADLDALTAEVTAAGGAIDSIETTLGDQGASITSLQTTVSNHTGTLATHTSQISTANANISTNATAITTANTNIANLTVRVGSAESSITTNATAITNLTGRTATLETTVSSQGASITSLQTTTSTLTGNLAEYQLRLSANRPNLLPNGSAEAGLRDFSGPPDWSFVATNPNGSYFVLGGGTTGTFVLESGNIALSPATYTLSYETNDTGNPTASCDAMCYDAGGVLLLDGGQNPITGPSSWNDRAARAFTFIAPAGTVNIRVRLIGVKTAASDRVRIRRIKLETGSAWSNYSGEASVAQSFTALTTAETSLASLSVTVGTQGSTITSHATAITNLTGRTATLETTVSSQGASITSLQTATSTLQGNVATLTTRVSAAGVNLLPNGGLEDGFNSGIASVGTFALSSSPYWGKTATTTTTGVQVFQFASVPVAGGATYTLSCDPILIFGASTGYVDVIGYNSSGTQVYDGPQSQVSGPFDFDMTTGRRGQIAITFTLPSTVATVRCRFVTNVAAGTICGFRQMKLEVGSLWTAYTAEASVAQSFSALSTLTTQYASLSTTVSTQGVTITTQQTAITTINGNITTLFGQYVLNVTVGGLVAGMKLANNGGATSLRFQSDLVTFESSSGTGQRTEYSGGNWRVYDAAGTMRVRMGVW